MNRDNDFVSIGESVDLHLGRGPAYRTKVEDLEAGRIVWVSVPYYRGIPIVLRRDQGLQLYFYRPSGRFCLDVKVVDFRMSGEVRLIAMAILHGPRRQQRRDSFRYRKKLPAVVRAGGAGPFPASADMEDMLDEERLYTENISETGALLLVKSPYETGETAYLRIYFNWSGADEAPPLELCCEVRSCTAVEGGRSGYHVGVMFTDLDDGMRRRIARFVLIQQQRDFKHKRGEQGE